MNDKTNVYDFSARSKNQLMSLIFVLETLNHDSSKIIVEDWQIVTVRITLKFSFIGNYVVLSKFSIYPIYKDNKYIENVITQIELCDYQRFVHVLNLNS